MVLTVVMVVSPDTTGAVGINTHVVYEGVGVVILISRDLDKIVPVHYWSHKVL